MVKLVDARLRSESFGVQVQVLPRAPRHGEFRWSGRQPASKAGGHRKVWRSNRQLSAKILEHEAMSDLHFHCLLRQKKTHTTGWIEQRGAEVGKRVELEGEDGLWDVIEVHGPGRTLASLKEGEKRMRRGMPSTR